MEWKLSQNKRLIESTELPYLGNILSVFMCLQVSLCHRHKAKENSYRYFCRYVILVREYVFGCAQCDALISSYPDFTE